MRRKYTSILAVLSCLTVIYPARAALVSGPDIIPAPDSVMDDPPGATNDLEQAFDEAQCVILPRDVSVDGGGVIAEGTAVSSHMIFLNTVGNVLAEDFCELWEFDRPVIGVMSNSNGSLEVASSDILGAAGTIYPAAPFAARGLERNNQDCTTDGYLVAGNTIEVSMRVTEPGDWIRVVTECLLAVEIDIKPGSDPNCFNIDGHGVVPVAINGTEDFDVTLIDIATLNFAGLWVKVKGNGAAQCSVEDWNEDGIDDLVCQFEDDADLWAPGDGEATLTGELLDGTPFAGTDSICLRP